jgi:hypothetical protein
MKYKHSFGIARCHRNLSEGSFFFFFFMKRLLNDKKEQISFLNVKKYENSKKRVKVRQKSAPNPPPVLVVKQLFRAHKKGKTSFHFCIKHIVILNMTF